MSSLGMQMRRLGRHSAVYGLGGIVSRVLAVFLLPLYTRYLTRRLRAVGVLIALSAVLVTILRAGDLERCSSASGSTRRRRQRLPL
jgi:O-antigen/teichoic acid export membrane protein